MSYERTERIMGENKSILLMSGELFQNVPIKVKKADIAASLVNGVLKAGTLLSKDGKVVDGTTVTNDKAFGVVYKDMDFTYSNGNETVSITIFGFINEKALPKEVPLEAKAAMKMLMFL